MDWQEDLWPEWKMEDVIGRGSYGNVYRIRREDESGVYFAALKVISICPGDDRISLSHDGIKSSSGSGANDSDHVKQISREIAFMETLKGNSNIVSYEDHRIVFHRETGSWNILLRMELLTPLAEYFRMKARSEEDVVRLGIDICNALKICEIKGIMHRDVKPGNIFVSEFGDFKLGDFGIALITHNKQTMRDPLGTRDYIAPEALKHRLYNQTTDLYALGIVMYKILNQGVVPFSEKNTSPAIQDLDSGSEQGRQEGVPLPMPCEASDRLGKLILKACSYKPEDRFQSAEAMGAALRQYQMRGSLRREYRTGESGLEKSGLEKSGPGKSSPVKPGPAKPGPGEEKPRRETDCKNHKKSGMNRFFTSAGDLDV